ncbi:MAG: tetratricopeptide repeat protein [Verrucomicrobiaceae bacterium]
MPDPTELLELLQDAEENDQLVTARFLYEALLLEEPENGGLLVLHASNLIELGALAEAESVLSQAEELGEEETLSGLKTQQAHLARARGDSAGAEALYREAHKLDDSDDENLINAAAMAFQRGEAAKAEFLIREAIALGGEGVIEARFALGGYLVAQERYEEATRCYETVVKLDPENELAREWLADLNFREVLSRPEG